jgi:DNA-binding CsgD family transcriptional regulator
MEISSRTPDGPAGRCPVCGQIFCLNPSFGLRDAPCPFCGQLVFPIILVPSVQDLSETLTPREREIYELRCEGRSTDEIARMLFRSRRTVETHVAHIERKLGLGHWGERPA